MSVASKSEKNGQNHQMYLKYAVCWPLRTSRTDFCWALTTSSMGFCWSLRTSRIGFCWALEHNKNYAISY